MHDDAQFNLVLLDYLVFKLKFLTKLVDLLLELSHLKLVDRGRLLQILVLLGQDLDLIFEGFDDLA